jgi:putative heme-binding domain-containing protein
MRFSIYTASLAAVLLLTGQSAFAQRDLTDIPPPDPVAEMAVMKPTADAVVNLYASDPQIRKPIQVNFDSRGRLWVASSEVYPQIAPGQIANDKIVVLEDTTGDGICDKSIVFAEGLLIPTGIIPDENGGAYVAASTELLHFTDSDGDGVADQRRVVLSGFGTEDTHHLIHTLRWGPDGCLYFNQSIYIHSHIETAYGTRHLDGGGIWRYRPETGELSVFCKGFVNPWGHVFDAHGESFVTDGAYFEGINYAFPDSVFVTSPGAMRWLSGMNPGSPKHCGLEIISGKHFPEQWSGDLVTSDFRGQRVCRFTVRPSQSSYTSRQQPEILTSGHIAFRPIDARMGPDGALYVADWYNPIIQHGEVDFRDERRDREHGRIWRVHFPDRPLDRLPDFESASTDELVALLESPSLNVRQFARQHLWPRVRQNPDEVLGAVASWRDAKLDRTVGSDQASRSQRGLEHQWLGEVAGRFLADSFEQVAATTSGPVSRTSLRSGVRAAGHDHPAVAHQLKTAALGEHAPSRLEAVAALGQIESADQAVTAAEILIAVADGASQASPDPVLDFALWQSLRKLSGAWVEALRNNQLAWQPHANGLAYAVSAAASGAASDAVLPLLSDNALDDAQKRSLIHTIAASGDAAVLAKLLQMALASGEGRRVSDLGLDTLQQLVARTRRDRTVPSDAPRLLTERFGSADRMPENEPALRTIIAAVGLWQADAMLPLLLELASDNAPPAILLPTINALGRFDNAAAAAALHRWAAQGHRVGRPEAAVEAVTALAARQPNRAAAAAVALLAELEDGDAANRLLVELKPNKAVAKAIATELAKAELPPDRARALLTAVRGAGGDEAIEKSLQVAGRLDSSGWEPTAELAAEILAAAKTSGDPHRGETVYRRAQLQCINCHAIGTAGGLVGPNLISLGSSSQPDYILESLWLPDAKLKEGYNTVSVLTDDGRVTSGIPIGRSEETLKLRLADGQEVEIATESIDDEQPGKSLMPTGSVDTLTKDELVELVAFLSALGRDPAFTVSTDNIVRNYETLVFSPEANRRLNRTSTDAVATDDATFTWRQVTTRVDGQLPIEELDQFKQHQTTPQMSFVRFDVTVADGQPAPRIEIPTEAMDVWVDGKPTPVWDVSSRQLEPGTHRIVIGINRDQFSGEFKVKLAAP